MIVKMNSISYIIRPNVKFVTIEEIKETIKYASTIKDGYVMKQYG